MHVLRLAVVGAGAQPTSRARRYLATIAKLAEYYELAAICDGNPEVAEATAGQYSARSWYRDMEEMLRAERPDVVLCLVPSDGQAPVALTAVEHGAHLMTEIPYGITPEIGDAIAAACTRRGLQWEIAEQVWLWPRERLKRQIVETGLLGAPTHARLWYSTGFYHGFNALRMLLDSEPQRVLGHTWEVEVAAYTAYGGQPMVSARGESAVVAFGAGVHCLYEKAPRPYGHFYPNRWEIEGTEGAILGEECVRYESASEERHRLREVYTEVRGERLLEKVCVDTDPPLAWENPFLRYGIGEPDDIAKASLLCGLHRAIVKGQSPLYGPANARRDLEVGFALFESARRSAAWVELPLSQPTPLAQQAHDTYRRRYGHDPIQASRALLGARFGRSGVWWEVANWL